MHTHTCRLCRHEWECMTGRKTQRECAVTFAAMVNGQGPYCELCLALSMARRQAKLRGLRLTTELEKIR